MSDNLNDLFDSFEEKVSILDDDFVCLKKVAKKLIKKVQDEKKSIENMIKQYKRYENVESDIVKLNVGGTIFSTLKTTLIKKVKDENGELYQPNMFEILLNGFVKPKYDENRAIFIDRNPKYFTYILDYLRMANSRYEYEIPEELDISELLKEAEFYNIQGLIETAQLVSNGFQSTIIKPDKVKHLLKLCEFKTSSRWNLLYRGSRDGSETKNFHSHCDNKPYTLTIIKSTDGYIFGGYTTQLWDCSNTYKTDHEAFLFSFVDQRNIPMKIKQIYPSGHNAIYCSGYCGPTFGNGHDLHLCDDTNLNCSNFSNLGFTYKPSNNFIGPFKTLLAGSYNFKVAEIEVFQKIFD